MSGQTFNNSSIDRGFGWLLLGLGVFVFFALVIAGLSNVEENAEEVAERPSAFEVVKPKYDLAH